MPGYALLDAHVRTLGVKVYGRPLDVSLKATNILNARRVEPGTLGVDLPQPGRGFSLQVTQSL